MPPGRRHVFTSLASLHLHRDANDAERCSCRFPDGSMAVESFRGEGQDKAGNCDDSEATCGKENNTLLKSHTANEQNWGYLC